jgi:hypothetical protein
MADNCPWALNNYSNKKFSALSNSHVQSHLYLTLFRVKLRIFCITSKCKILRLDTMTRLCSVVVAMGLAAKRRWGLGWHCCDHFNREEVRIVIACFIQWKCDFLSIRVDQLKGLENCLRQRFRQLEAFDTIQKNVWLYINQREQCKMCIGWKWSQNYWGSRLSQ